MYQNQFILCYRTGALLCDTKPQHKETFQEKIVLKIFGKFETRIKEFEKNIFAYKRRYFILM